MRKIAFILFVCAMLFFDSYAQNTSSIDSLKGIIAQTKHDTIRLNALLKLSTLQAKDSIQSLRLSKEALSLAKKLGKKYEAKVLQNIARNYKETQYFKKALLSINKAHAFSEKNNLLPELGSCYYLKGQIYFGLENIDSSLFYHKKALSIYKIINDPKSISSNLNAIGLMFWRRGQLDSANNYYKESLEIRKKLNESETLSTVYNNLGAVNWGLSNYNSALDYFLKALEITRKIKNEKRIVLITNNIGLIYQEWGQYEKALTYHAEATELAKRINYPVGLAYSYINTGACYRAKKEYKKAIEVFELAINQYLKETKAETVIGIALIYRHLGETYISQKKYDKAINYLNNSIKEASKVNSMQHIAVAHQLLGKAFFLKNIFSNAIIQSELAFKLAVENNYKETIKESAFILSYVYETQKDYKNSLKYFKIANTIKDSIFNDKTGKQIAEMQAKYETGRQLQQIKLQKSELAKKTSEIKQKENQQKMLFAGLFFISIIVLLIIISNVKIKKAKTKISIQKKELEAANNLLIELSEYKETLTGMIVHDLKNPLNIISNTTNIPQIKEPVSRMYNLVMNILDVQKFQSSKMKINEEELNLSAIIKTAYQQVQFLVERKNIDFIVLIPNELTVFSDNEKLERVLINLLHNAAKYTPNNGKITISISSLSINKIKLSLHNTGEIIPENEINNIFSKFEQYKPIKDSLSASTGLGLTFCKMAMNAMHQEIGVESSVENGTTFWISLQEGTKNAEIKMNTIEKKEKKEVFFSEEEEKVIEILKKELNKYEIFEISNLKIIIEQAKQNKSKKIVFWANELENSILVMNETQFNELRKIN